MAILQQFAGSIQHSWSKKKGGYPACEGRRRDRTVSRGLNRGRRHEWLAGGLCRQLSVTRHSRICPPCSCRSTGVRKAAGHAQNVLANILKERRRRSRLERWCESCGSVRVSRAIQCAGGTLDTTSMDASLIDELTRPCRSNSPMRRANHVRHPTTPCPTTQHLVVARSSTVRGKLRKL